MPFSSNALIVLAASTGSSGSKSGGGGFGIIFLVLIVLAGYMLFMRPARARQRAAMQTRSNIEPGVEVTTTAGLIATVVAVDDDTVTLEVAPGVHSRYVKAAIGRVNTPPEPETPDAPDTEETDTSGDTPAGTGS
ncbi:MAG TPA: preprotein translocase subunit YajC [Mycobacteriales bacterium]|nr:preprotein translocase subunit YajC [Mycobacteriales bacterium]